MARIEEIDNRMAEIKHLLENANANSMTDKEVDLLEEEVQALKNERSTIMGVEHRRNTLLGEIAGGAGNPIPNLTVPMVQRNQTAVFPYDSPEYRSAWLNRIRGNKLTEAEERAYSSAAGSGAEVIPTHTASEIMSKVRKGCPLLDEITLLRVKGNVKYAVEGTNNNAALHTENAAITAANDTLVTVSLGGYEVIKLVVVSDTVRTMSISSFETWLADMLGDAIASKINSLIVNGTGSSEPKGIEKANTWNDTNSVTVAKTEKLTAANVQELIGLLKTAYDKNAKFLMSKRTLFTDFMPLQDTSKNHIVTVQDGNYYVYGYPILLCDDVATHEAYLGDFRKYIGNLPEEVNVKSAYNIDNNNYKYSGIAMFDGAPAISEAFVKLARATE